MHLESGDDVVIVNGLAAAVQKPSPELGLKVAQAYAEKYAAFSYSPAPNQWDHGGLYAITPCTVLAWTNFVDDPTKFVFDCE